VAAFLRKFGRDRPQRVVVRVPVGAVRRNNHQPLGRTAVPANGFQDVPGHVRPVLG